MSSGFYLVSGFMHINMGCEVMFVLSNRMKAQNVDMNTVGSKILCDVTLVMFKKSFMDSMLKMQSPVTIPTLYEIFNKIVNCSLMKLDKNSMQKLFYLVLMTFKRQLFLMSSPLQLYTLTITHLQDVAEIQKNNAQSLQCIQNAISIFKKQAEKYTYMIYLDLKQEMLSMFESYKSKIVLFCQSGAQDQNGCLIFETRNTHNRKNIGLGQNHPTIQFPNDNNWISKRNLQLNNYKNWKTSLGKDDYDNVRGSSKVLQMKPKTKKNLQEDHRQISDILGIKNMKLDSYEVKIDIFESQTQPGSKKENTSKKSQNIKVAETKIDNDIKKKIEKQFDDLALENEKKEGEDQIDLLELMDS